MAVASSQHGLDPQYGLSSEVGRDRSCKVGLSSEHEDDQVDVSSADQVSDQMPVFHYKSAPLKRRPPANIYREEISPRRLHTGKMSPPGDISYGKKSPVGGKIIRPRHAESAYPIIIPPTP